MGGQAASGWDLSCKWVGLKLQVGCKNQQKILIGLLDVMWVVLSVHAPGGGSGRFFLRSVKKKKRTRQWRLSRVEEVSVMYKYIFCLFCFVKLKSITSCE